MTNHFSPAKLVSNNECTVLAGVFDPLSAKCLMKAGFQSAILTGYSVAATYLGEPDIGLMTQTEVVGAARRIKNACPDLFLIVDGDNGHGGRANVLRLVRELTSCDANGVILEDQVWPKKCGHMEKKEIVSLTEHIGKIETASNNRPSDNFLVIARTDSRAIEGLEGAILRAKALKKAGADMIFIEAPLSKEELKRIAEEVEGSLIANMVPGGKTPWLSKKELEELNYAAVLYPLQALYAATTSMLTAYSHLAENEKENEFLSFNQFNELIGIKKYEDL